MVDRAVKASQNWSYNQLITHMTGNFYSYSCAYRLIIIRHCFSYFVDMIKISWDFQKAADWESTVKVIRICIYELHQNNDN